uniref:GRF-type domain-containing protein n=1 Tax=Arundo donax TaxID=35708 RepID=A0A0A9HVJ4_ARUDO
MRHIVCVHKSRLARRHYFMLVDIVGDDSWRTFQDVRKRFDGFVLFVQWHAKQVAPGGNNSAVAPAPAPAPVAAAVTDGRGRARWPICKHNRLCTIETSWDRQDPGRRFYRCDLFADPSQDCGFTQWLDIKIPENATWHINSLLDSVSFLELQVENLEDELYEIHQRYLKSADSDSASRGSRDTAPRPRKVRRLARDN